MLGDIFDADYFDDDIVEEDVDIFDDNYCEASEGNPINKAKKKEWESRETQKMSDNSQYKEDLNDFRKANRAGTGYNYRLEGKDAYKKRDPQAASIRDRLLASNPGNVKGRNADKHENYKYRYTNAQWDTAMQGKDPYSHKNVVYTMNHPSKK